MSETMQCFTWLASTMRADITLMANATGVYETFAPIGTAMPYVQFNQQSGNDKLTMNAARLYSEMLIQIKAVGYASNYAVLATIADRIDALFARVGVTALSVGGILSCYRETTIAMDEIVSGQVVSHLGGIYRIALQKS